MEKGDFFPQANLGIGTWRHEYVRTNEIQLHCVVQGQGPLVILLHDFLEFWYSWRHQIPVLSRSFKVVVPDLRGYNDSDKPASGYDLETLSRDIHGLIGALGYRQAVVVGHGWGGTIAYHLAQHFPQSLQSLVLLASPHPQRLAQELTSNLDQLRRNWYFLAAQVPGLPEWLLHQNLPGLISDLFQNQAVRKGAFSAEVTRIYQAALAKPGVLTAALNYYRQFFTPSSLWRLLSRPTEPIHLPTLILWGEDDTIFSPPLIQGFESFVQAPLQSIAIPHCGHWLQQEAPQTVNRALLNFLRQERGIADPKLS